MWKVINKRVFEDLFKWCFVSVYYVYVCVYVHVSAGTLRGQKRAVEPLELELTSVYNVSDRGMGNWTLILCESCT